MEHGELRAETSILRGRKNTELRSAVENFQGHRRIQTTGHMQRPSALAEAPGSVGKLPRLLASPELGEEHGIRVRLKSERGTSKRCSICGQRHKNGRIHRGLYKCERTGRTVNADVNGACNILYGRKVAAVSGSGPLAWPLLLKWDTQHWQVSAA